MWLVLRRRHRPLKGLAGELLQKSVSFFGSGQIALLRRAGLGSVILSVAKDLLLPLQKKILRFAQDDVVRGWYPLATRLATSAFSF